MLDASASRPPDEDFYPYYSEEPVTESDWHRIAIRYLEQSLSQHFADRADAYISSNLFVYYQEGDRAKNVSPDVFVCFGSDKEQRSVHRNWSQGIPFAVFEVTSESSRLSDQGEKRAKYTVMGIQEYYLFDPLGEYLSGQLRAYRRQGEELIPVVCGSKVASEGLGITMEVQDKLLRIYHTETGRAYLTHEETRKEAEEQQARAEEQQARAEAAEERVRLLEEELRRREPG